MFLFLTFKQNKLEGRTTPQIAKNYITNSDLACFFNIQLRLLRPLLIQGNLYPPIPISIP